MAGGAEKSGRSSPGGGALALSRPGGQRRLEAHFPAAAGRRQSGDVVSWYLGAAGVPWGRYLSAGLAGSLPRVAAATLLGTSLWDPGSSRFYLSLGLGAGMSVLAAALWRIWRS